MAYRFKHIGIGGTFDLLHRGHVAFLQKAFKAAQVVSIGITTDKFCKELGKLPFENQITRRKNLQNYLQKRHLLKRARIFWENDIYGSAVSDKTIKALIVSKSTLPGANQINLKRKSLKLKPLKVVLVPYANAYDKKPISSERIRNGEIDRNGTSYKLLLNKIANKRLPDKIRSELKKPFGKYVQISKSVKNPYFAIGDITVQNFLKVGLTPQISIVDFYVARERKFSSLTNLGFKSSNPDYIVKNEPGLISLDLIAKIQTAINLNRKVIILVVGEEDLAAIPVMLLAPLGSTVYYGQPKKSAVCVNVTEKIKEDLVNLLVK